MRDPLGGINSLWPLFGIANQLLAAIGLCLGTTIILKMQLVENPAQSAGVTARPAKRPLSRSPTLALLTFVPLVWLLAVTGTAGVEKMFSRDARIGFLAAAADCRANGKKLTDEIAGQVTHRGVKAQVPPQSETEARESNRWRIIERNNIIDAVVAGIFLSLVSVIVILSAREWALLLARRKQPVLRESEPVWLPDYAIAEARPVQLAGLAALVFALTREISGQGHVERAQMSARLQAQERPEPNRPGDGQVYAEVSDRRFKGFTSCC